MYRQLRFWAIIGILILQTVLGAPTAKYDWFPGEEEDCSRYWVDYGSTDPRTPISGVWIGEGWNLGDVELGDLAINALADAQLLAQCYHLRPYKPAGITVYVNGNRDVVVAAIGGGTMMHGEQNVQTVCKANNIEFSGGKIFTYTDAKQFIPACGHPDQTGNPNDRNCRELVRGEGIADYYAAVARVTRPSPTPRAKYKL